MDKASTFNVPLVANGRVFIASQTQLTAYGLLPYSSLVQSFAIR
jgi:hypothetical protein